MQLISSSYNQFLGEFKSELCDGHAIDSKLARLATKEMCFCEAVF